MTDLALRLKVERALCEWFSGEGAEVLDGCIETGDGHVHALDRLAEHLLIEFKVEPA